MDQLERGKCGEALSKPFHYRSRRLMVPLAHVKSFSEQDVVESPGWRLLASEAKAGEGGMFA